MEDKKYIYHDNIGYVSLLQCTGIDKTVADAARVSFNRDTPGDEELSPKDKKLIEYLAKHQHTSPFEHCSITFRVKVPLCIAKQHMRHRTWSYNEVSRRYTSENIEFYLPRSLRRQAETNRQASVDGSDFNPALKEIHGSNMIWPQKAVYSIEKAANEALKLYNDLLASGVSREQARMVLPQSTYTEYWATANLLNIIKFLRLRLASDAQWEIRMMAQAMAEFVHDKFPETYETCREYFLT